MLSKIFSVILLLCLSTVVDARWYQHRFNVMGTQAEVELWHDNPAIAKQLIEAVEAEMNRIDQRMSPYIETSEVYKINQLNAGDKLKISNELFDLISRSIEFSKLSHGAFDITFASVGYRYDYREKIKPSDDFIEHSKTLIDYRSIHLDTKTKELSFTKNGMKIDLGGIAKGHAVDRCIDILRRHGVENAFVKAGGDSRLLGDKRGRLWTIGIQHPRNKEQILTQVPLENVAISTSGDYERFFIDNGERVHHILDPKTGKSAKKSISVSIIAPDSTTADALSTTVFILGFEQGLALINNMADVSAIIIDSNGQFHYSDDLISN
jgi:thiamine biosynthesis lipoprotein